MKRRNPTPAASHVDEDEVDDVVDVLCQNLARADAMVCATEHQLERFTWGSADEEDGEDDDDDDDDDRGRRLDHLAHLLGATKEAVRAARYAGGEVAAKLAQRPKRV